ncbi:MAG: DNA polymerase IV [Hyphomicrobiales bacterium]|nr:DNA polymerase IV [Hyphomicrobiales bacterium]MCP5372275.1 DNA polymerase IV [Hyphomicrobiales bacterium]
MEPGTLSDGAQRPLAHPATAAAGLCRDCLALWTGAGGDCPRCGSPRTVGHGELRDLAIAHIDCDAFYAAVEKRDDPSLRDKPLIVGHAGGRGVVTTACYIARQYGPRSAMPMFKALELCPHAVVLRPDMAKYKRVSDQIRAIFRAATEVIEPVSLDEAYLDLSDGLRADLRPPAVALAAIAQRVEREVGITVSIGLSYNKFLAKLASDLDKPRGFSVIGRGEARAFLRDLPVRKINGVGEATAQRMAKRGITRIGQLQEMSELQLVNDYGRFGRRLAQYAQGQDSRKVTPHRPSKSVSAETTFARDLNGAAQLIEALRPLCERVASRLERGGLAGTTVVLKLKTADFHLHTRNRRLPHPTQRAAEIFRQARTLVEREADGRFFRLIGIGVSDIVPAAEADPPDLFDGLA